VKKKLLHRAAEFPHLFLHISYFYYIKADAPFGVGIRLFPRRGKRLPRLEGDEFPYVHFFTILTISLPEVDAPSGIGK
jgi:hypothetical protein